MFAVGWFVMPVQATTMTIVQQATTDAHPRPRRGRAQRGDPDGVDRVDGGGRHPRRRHRHPRRCSALGGVVAALAAVLAWLLFRGAEREVTDAEGALAAGVEEADGAGDRAASRSGDTVPAA